MKLVLPILVLLTCAAAGADPLALPGDPSKLSCSSSMPECDLVVVTEVAKAALEKLPDHERLQLRFSNSSNAQLATIAKLPWVKRVGVLEGITDLTPIAKLSHVEEVHVVTKASLAPLAAMPTLRRLAIATELDFGELSAFEKLSELDVLMANCGSACVATIGTMTWLHSLDIAPRDVPARDLSPLARLTQLEALRIFDSELKDLSLLVRMKQLRKLSLQGNAKLSDIRQLSGLAELREVELTNGNAVHDARVLMKLPKLEFVNLSDDAMSNADKQRLQAAHPDAHVY